MHKKFCKNSNIAMLMAGCCKSRRSICNNFYTKYENVRNMHNKGTTSRPYIALAESIFLLYYVVATFHIVTRHRINLCHECDEEVLKILVGISLVDTYTMTKKMSVLVY